MTRSEKIKELHSQIEKLMNSKVPKCVSERIAELLPTGLPVNDEEEGLFITQVYTVGEYNSVLLLYDRKYESSLHKYGTYEELFDEVWRMCQSNMEFSNYTASLRGRTHDSNSYIRFVNEYDDCFECRLCPSNGITKVTHSDGDITIIDPEGGPQISINNPLIINGKSYIVRSIRFDDDKSEYYITIEK